VTDASGSSITFRYNSRGEITRLTDRNGSTTHYYYDSRGNLIRVMDPEGNNTTYSYDLANRLVTVTEPANRTTQFRYNELGEVTGQVDPVGNVTSFQYDPLGRLIKETDPRGYSRSYRYDFMGNVTRETGPESAITKYSYDLLGNPVRVEDALGNVSKLQYDALGQVVKSVNALGAVTEYDYDAAGNVAGVTNPLGNTTQYSYDFRNNLTKVTDALGNSTNYHYDRVGNLLSVEDAGGSTTSLKYDNLNRLVAEINPLKQKTSYGYDDAGNLTEKADPLGQVTEYDYDKNNRLTGVNFNGEEFASFRYNGEGSVGSMVSPALHEEYYYDDMGHLEKIEDLTRDKALKFQYDAVGNRISTTDAEDRTTSYRYDGSSRMVQLTDPDGNVTIFGYDDLGRVSGISRPNGVDSGYTYDAAGRVTGIENTGPKGLISSFAYQYDAAGNRTSQVEEDGAETTYQYDELNRLSEVNYPVEKIEKLRTAYILEQPQVKIPAQEILPGGGSREKTTGKEKGNSGKGKGKGGKKSGSLLSLSYDLETGFTDNTGVLLAKGGKGKGKGSSGGGGSKKSGDSGKSSGKEKGSSKSGSSGKDSGKGSNSGKEKRKNKDHPGKGKAKGKEKGKKGKGWGKGGRWRNMESFFNQEGELLSTGTYPAYLVEPVENVSYSYDAAGNRISMTKDGEETKYTYDAANRLLRAGGTGYDYDANGNLVFKVKQDGTRTEYQYNAANRLDAVYFEDGTDLQYAYDGYGRKVSREETYWQVKEKKGKGKEKSKGKGKQKSQGNNAKLRTESTAYLYDGKKVAKEYTGNGSPLAEYQIGPKGAVSRKMFGYKGRKEQGKPTLQTRGGLLYYSNDAIGNVTDLTDRTGDVISKFRFDAFGGMFAGTLAPYNFTGLTGKEYDPKSGLMDYGARWYDTETGRFIQPDTYKGNIAKPRTQHTYAYVGNNPINRIDPTGHFDVIVDGDDVTIVYDDEEEADEWEDDVDEVHDEYDDSDVNIDEEHNYDDDDSGGGSGGSSDDDDYSPPPPTPEEEHQGFNSEAPAQPQIQAVSSRQISISSYQSTGQYLSGITAKEAEENRRGLYQGVADFYDKWIKPTDGELALIQSTGPVGLPLAGGFVVKKLTANVGSKLLSGVKKIGGRIYDDVIETVGRMLGKGAGNGGNFYHYTSANPESILKNGLQSGSSGKVFTTPSKNLSPLQAQIDLALPPNRGLPKNLLEIDVPTLRNMGIEIPQGKQVTRMFNMPGGGTEVVFPHAIPSEAIKLIK